MTAILSDEQIKKAALHFAAPEANHPDKKLELAIYLERERIEAFEEGAEFALAAAEKRVAELEAVVNLVREYESEWANPSTDLVYRRRVRERMFAALAPKVKP